MFNKMLLSERKPSYLTRYGFTYQTSGTSGNLMSIENYITKYPTQDERFDTVQISDMTATYRLEYFIDTTAAEPQESDRGYNIRIVFRDEQNQIIGSVQSEYVKKGKTQYVTKDFVCPENTVETRITAFRYPSTTGDVNKVVYSGIQLYKLDTATPLPDSPIPLKSCLEAGQYYIEYDGAKYEFSLPELNGVSKYRDVFYFDKKKKSAFVVKYVNRHLLDISASNYEIHLFEASWAFNDLDNYCGCYISIGAPNALNVQHSIGLYNRLKPGKWAWYNLPKGNYGYAYTPQNVGIFYLVLANSYTGITSSDTDNGKKTKLSSWLKNNPIDMVYPIAPTKKIPIPLTKVQTTTATKLDIWEE